MCGYCCDMLLYVVCCNVTCSSAIFLASSASNSLTFVCVDKVLRGCVR